MFMPIPMEMEAFAMDDMAMPMMAMADGMAMDAEMAPPPGAM